MNKEFDELTKSLAQSVTLRVKPKRFDMGLAGISLAGLLMLPTITGAAVLGPPLELSFPSPLTGCDDGLRPGGTWTIQDAAEPYVAVNPINPKNVVAAWMSGFVQGVIAAVSFDGGQTWQLGPLPLTVCAGGPSFGAGDPWLAFAPNGDLYASALTGNAFSALLVACCKSTDGGLHWSAPAIINSNENPDKSTITTDPSDPRFVYAAWDQGPPTVGVGSQSTTAQFARSTNAGLTWEPQQAIGTIRSAGSCQVLVLTNGALLYLFVDSSKNIVYGARSTDRGHAWSAPTSLITMMTLPTSSPDQGLSIRAGIPSCAVDGRNGNVYVVWQDGRFSNFQHNDIAFSMSADGGLTWSSPIRINQTPLNIAPANQEAFIPVIAVRADGTIGVLYYDFRFNDSNPAALTDCWLVQCSPSTTTPATTAASWGSEVRLTAQSFDIEAAIDWFGLFIGDYEGLAATGKGFIASFGAVDGNGVTSIFSRRVGP
jgi:hypothetical protein